MRNVKVVWTRDEALAAIITLEKVKRPFVWQQKALDKLLKAMGLEAKKCWQMKS